MVHGETPVVVLVEDYQSGSGNLENFQCIQELLKIGLEQSVDMEEEDLDMGEMDKKDQYIQLHVRQGTQEPFALLEILVILKLNILTVLVLLEVINLMKTHFIIKRHGQMRVAVMNALMVMIEAVLTRTDSLHSSSSSKILEDGE
jgi:competence protein ComGC